MDAILVFFIIASLTVFVSLIWSGLHIFKGEILLQLPIQSQQVTLTIPKNGFYGIWIKGTLFKANPLRGYSIKLIDEQGKSPINLHILGYARKNSFTESTVLEKSYYLKQGQYKLVMTNQDKSVLDQQVVDQGNFIIKKTLPLMVLLGVNMLLAVILSKILRLFMN
ncbi:hypothetical protein [Aggregatibacter kilianii]|uniref:hypothetical protein n=1 Tax=Aggregatibacter kilianii TaxID=2025884 RepID=UPI0028D54885|nr:hypothetical protein [Aggregatibacter kilianii]